METSLSTIGAGREGGSDGAGGTLTTAAADGVPSIWADGALPVITEGEMGGLEIKQDQRALQKQ